jgi:hypothetical protein
MFGRIATNGAPLRLIKPGSAVRELLAENGFLGMTARAGIRLLARSRQALNLERGQPGTDAVGRTSSRAESSRPVDSRGITRSAPRRVQTFLSFHRPRLNITAPTTA